MPRHAQVQLRRTVNSSLEFHTCWVPEELAHEGKTIELQQADGSWSTGWKVFEVGKKLDTLYVLGHARDYLKQREASDI